MAHTKTPPMVPSDEATRKQLEMAKEQGKEMGKALRHMTEDEATGEERRVGDYLVGYAVEHAEGMYMLEDHELVWHNPDEENAHIEISVRDAGDGRFVPGLTVRLTVRDADEKKVGTHVQPFIWHPWLYHYGRNWVIPGDGEYSFEVTIEAPDFHRHDKKNGKRFADTVEMEFKHVKIETGQKIS